MHFIIYSNSITLYEPIANYILIETAARGIVIVGNWNYKQFKKKKLLYRKKIKINKIPVTVNEISI